MEVDRFEKPREEEWCSRSDIKKVVFFGKEKIGRRGSENGGRTS